MAAKKKRTVKRVGKRNAKRTVSLDRRPVFPLKYWGLLAGVLIAGAVFLSVMATRPGSSASTQTRHEASSALPKPVPNEPQGPKQENAKPNDPVASPQHRILAAFEGIAEEIEGIHAAERTLAEQTLADFPDSVEARILMAKVLRHHGDSDGAMRLLQQALALAPKRGELFDEMVVIAKDKGDWQQAQAILKQGIEAVPRAPGLHWHLADILVTQGQYEAALPLLEIERTLAPHTTRVHYLLGQVYSQLGEFDLAQENLDMTVRLNPNHVNAYYALGSLCLKQKQRDQAKTYMETFRRLNAQFQTHVDERDRAGDVKRARERVARFCYLSHKIYYGHGQRGIAGQLLEQAATLDPSNPRIVERQAVLAYQEKQFDRAVILYEKASQLDPSKAIYLLNLSNIYGRLGRPDQAETVLKRTLSQFPEDPRAYQALIRLYLDHGLQAGQAVRLAEQVLALQETAENYFLLAWAHYAQHDMGSARAAIQAALQRDPGNPKYRGMHDQIKHRSP